MLRLYGPEYLRRRLSVYKTRVQMRYDYYEMKNLITDFSPIIPSEYKSLRPVMGWCAKAVDSVADRLVFDTFSNDDFKVNEIFKNNNNDIFFDAAAHEALIASCCFVYIRQEDNGTMPILQVITADNATGIIDPSTLLLTEGYAVLEKDADGNALLEAYFTADETIFYDKRVRGEYSVKNPAPYPLLVPIINRSDARRAFGHSRISRACIEYTQQALRTIRRSEIAADFYSFPQKYILGLSPDSEPYDKMSATISSLLQFDKDEDGDHPIVGQFQQQSMTPFLEHLKSIASMFAGETGLTLDDLGFATENPSSSEAIKAGHETLRLTVKKAQRDFAVGFRNVGYVAACLRDKYGYSRYAFADTAPSWQPIFEPDAASLSGAGDAILKINQAVPGYIGSKNLKQLTGMENDNGE